jgi:hypothetical protein
VAVKNRDARTHFQGWATDTTVLAASDPSATLVALKTNYTIYVTLISVAVTTDNAATLSFQDTVSTAVVIAKTKASPGIGPIIFEFGEDGTPLTANYGFALAASGAGLGARVHCEGYYKQSATFNA